MNQYTVIEQPNGKFSIMSGKVLLVDDMESREAAELAVAELNRQPSSNPVAFPNGRWTERSAA